MEATMLTPVSNRVNMLLLVLLVLMAGAIIAILATRASGGPLDPAGPPSSTLPQVEPRSPIPPVGWDGVSAISISTSGSYFLTRNLTQVPITIAAAKVTFDLNGFTLTELIGNNGIEVTAGTKRDIVVRNGTLVGPGGVGTGVFAPAAGRSAFIDLQISGWGIGMQIGTGNVVLRVDSHDNGTSGIEVDNGADFGGSIDDSNFSHNVNGIFLVRNNVEVRNSIMDTNLSSGVNMTGSWNEVSDSRMVGNTNFGADISGNRNALVRNHIDGNTGGSSTNSGAGNIIGPVSPATSANPAENIGF
jgi:hypothetical protein